MTNAPETAALAARLHKLPAPAVVCLCEMTMQAQRMERERNQWRRKTLVLLDRIIDGVLVERRTGRARS